MKVILFTSLYPGLDDPRRGVFVEKRLQHLLERSKEIEVTVVAPIPVRLNMKQLLPFKQSDYSKKETYNSVVVHRPKFISIPVLGKYINPVIMFLACYNTVRQLLSENAVELIDAHYFYPDGVAAALFGKLFDLPVVITARGTDINLFPNYFISRKYIQWAASYASAIITVSEALKRKLINLKVNGSKITTLVNGVDSKIFYPVNKDEAQKKINTNIPYIFSVGNLVVEKGHGHVIKALKNMPDLNYIIAGTGPLKGELVRYSKILGVQDRVKFVGGVQQSDLKYYYSAAEALVHPSSREGLPNVVLESLACGTPVVATEVGGLPEIIADKSVGLLVNIRDVDDIHVAIKKVIEMNLDRNIIKCFSEKFSWNDTSAGQLSIFRSVANKPGEVQK